MSIKEQSDVAKLDCAPIEVALWLPVAALRAEAERGDAQAQFAWSLVLANGLNGQVANPTLATDWRAKATAMRGTTVSQVYLPGINNLPGSLMAVSVPVYEVSLSQQIIVDSCVMVLNSSLDARSLARVEQGVCGGSENFVRLRQAWLAAKTHSLQTDKHFTHA